MVELIFKMRWLAAVIAFFSALHSVAFIAIGIVRGFQGYYLIDCACPDSGNIITTISMFDNWDSALASNESAKTFVKKRLADMLPEPADAVGGEVILSALEQDA